MYRYGAIPTFPMKLKRYYTNMILKTTSIHSKKKRNKKRITYTMYEHNYLPEHLLNYSLKADTVPAT